MPSRRPHRFLAVALVAGAAMLAAPSVAGAALTTEGSLRDCVEELGLTHGGEGDAPPGGDPRLGLDVPQASYAGWVHWPSDHLADVYLGRSVPAAKRAARRYQRFLERAGVGHIAVTRYGNVVIAGDDDGPPTRREVRRLRRCA